MMKKVSGGWFDAKCGDKNVVRDGKSGIRSRNRGNAVIDL